MTPVARAAPLVKFIWWKYGDRITYGLKITGALLSGPFGCAGCGGPSTPTPKAPTAAQLTTRANLWEKEHDLLKTAKTLKGQFSYKGGHNDYVNWLNHLYDPATYKAVNPLTGDLTTMQSDNFIVYALRSSQQKGFTSDAELVKSIASVPTSGAEGLYRVLKISLKYQEVKTPQNGDIVFLGYSQERGFLDKKKTTPLNSIWLHEGIYENGGMWHLDFQPGHVSYEKLNMKGPAYYRDKHDRITYLRPPGK